MWTLQWVWSATFKGHSMQACELASRRKYQWECHVWETKNKLNAEQQGVKKKQGAMSHRVRCHLACWTPTLQFEAVNLAKQMILHTWNNYSWFSLALLWTQPCYESAQNCLLFCLFACSFEILCILSWSPPCLPFTRKSLIMVEKKEKENQSCLRKQKFNGKIHRSGKVTSQPFSLHLAHQKNQSCCNHCAKHNLLSSNGDWRTFRKCLTLESVWPLKKQMGCVHPNDGHLPSHTPVNFHLTGTPNCPISAHSNQSQPSARSHKPTNMPHDWLWCAQSTNNVCWCNSPSSLESIAVL